MTRTFKIVMTLAVASLVAGDAFAQGPVRRTLRRTGQATANVVEGTAQATGNVIRGTANAAGNVVRGTAEVTGDVARGAANATGDVLRGTARVTRDVVTAPFGGPAYDGRYAAGYRGVQAGDAVAYAQPTAQAQAGVQQQVLRDRNGREFICDHGHRVYLNNTSTQSGQQQPAPTPADANQAAGLQQPLAPAANLDAQGATYGQQAAGQANVQAQTYSQPPAPPAAPTQSNVTQ